VTPPRAALRCAGAEASLKVALPAASATTSSGPVREQHGQRLQSTAAVAASSAGGSSNLRSTSRSVASGRVRGPSRRPRTTSTAADPRHRRPRARASADPGRRWIGRTRQFAETRLDRGRPARLPSRPRPTPRPASRSARAACPHPSLASSTSVRATCGSTSRSPAGSEPYPIPHAASSSRLMPSTRVAIATLVATPPRLSLSEHDQRARGRRQANPAATICWSPYSSPLTHAAMDAGLPPICVGQSSPLRVRRAVGRMTRVGQRSTVLHPVAS
jgi:hypothetical protein